MFPFQHSPPPHCLALLPPPAVVLWAVPALYVLFAFSYTVFFNVATCCSSSFTFSSNRAISLHLLHGCAVLFSDTKTNIAHTLNRNQISFLKTISSFPRRTPLSYSHLLLCLLAAVYSLLEVCLSFIPLLGSVRSQQTEKEYNIYFLKTSLFQVLIIVPASLRTPLVVSII